MTILDYRHSTKKHFVLLQLLVQRSQKEDGINGVTEKSFTVSSVNT